MMNVVRMFWALSCRSCSLSARVSSRGAAERLLNRGRLGEGRHVRAFFVGLASFSPSSERDNSNHLIRSQTDKRKDVAAINEKIPSLDDLRSMKPKALARACYRAVLAGADASKLLNRADVTLRSNLSELDEEGLRWLTVALARSKTFIRASSRSEDEEEKKGLRTHPLVLALRDQFENRLGEFSTRGAIEMLLRFSFCKVQVNPTTLRSVEERVEGNLLKLTDLQLSQFVSALSAQDYFSKNLPLHQEFYMRADTMDHRSMSQIFHYIAQCGMADRDLVSKVLSVLRHRVRTFPFVSLVRLVTGLLHGDITDCEEARLVGELVAEHVAQSNMRLIHPTDSCYLLEALVALEACSEELMWSLTENALRLPHLLRPRDFCQLLFIISTVTVPSVKHFSHRLLRAAQYVPIEDTSLTMKDIRLLCNGMMRLRFCLVRWLEPIEAYALQNFRELLRYKGGKDMIFIATVLSYLNYPAESLFGRLQVAFDRDEEGTVFNVSSGLVVRLLWACAVQNVFPTHGIAQLMKMSCEEVEDMTAEERRWLQQLNIVAARKGKAKSSCLKARTLQRLVDLMDADGSCMLKPDSAAEMCFTELSDCLSEGILQRDITTSEGCYVPGAFLLEFGKPTAWFEASLSAVSRSARQLRIHGLQPVAIVPVFKAEYSLPASRRLGTSLMQLRTLKVSGWDVLEVPVAEWAATSDKSDYIQQLHVITSDSREKVEPLDIDLEVEEDDDGESDDNVDSQQQRRATLRKKREKR